MNDDGHINVAPVLAKVGDGQPGNGSFKEHPGRPNMVKGEQEGLDRRGPFAKAR